VVCAPRGGSRARCASLGLARGALGTDRWPSTPPRRLRWLRWLRWLSAHWTRLPGRWWTDSPALLPPPREILPFARDPAHQRTVGERQTEGKVARADAPTRG
jgi:hypothetical protein